MLIRGLRGAYGLKLAIWLFSIWNVCFFNFVGWDGVAILAAIGSFNFCKLLCIIPPLQAS